MSVKSRTNGSTSLPTRWYRGADVPMRLIRRFARQVAERFQPDKIILFGSYAYGTPHTDSTDKGVGEPGTPSQARD